MSISSLSPSSLAAKETEFRDWATAIGIVYPATLPSDIEDDLGTLLEFKPPHCLLELQDKEGFASSRINLFQRHLRQWASNNLLELQAEDTQFSQRQGIHDLLDCAFLPGTNTSHNVIFDAGLRLSASAAIDSSTGTSMAPSRDPATIVRPKAVADAIVIIQRPGFAADASVAAYHKKMNFDPSSESQWASDIKAGPQVTSIIGFAGEYKSRLSTSTHHQLIMDLTTAQCQRKAIGLPNATLYGVTVHQGEFSIYASWWMPDRIAFGQSRNGRTFNLNDPIDLLRCFFFLRMLRPRIIGNMGDEFANLSPSAAVQSLATFRWRMEDRRKHPSKWLHSGNESEHRKKRRSAQQESMNEVPSLCEDEDEIEDFTRQELDAWSDTRDTYRQEAATLLSELGATIHCVAVYRIVSHMQLCSIRDDHLIS